LNKDNLKREEYLKEKEKYENLKTEIYYLLSLISNKEENHLNNNLLKDSNTKQNKISKIIDYIGEEANKISNEINLRDKEIINFSNLNKDLYLSLEKIENEIKKKDIELNTLKEIYKATKIEFHLIKNSLKPIALRNAYKTEDLSKIKDKKRNLINSQIENLEKVDKEINEKKNLIILKKNVIESTKEEINLNKIELDNKNIQITNLKKNIDEFNMIINKSTTQMEEQKEKINILNKEINEINIEIEEINKTLLFKKNNYEDIKRDLKNISKDLNSIIFYMNLEKIDRLDKIDHLKKQLLFQKEELERFEKIKENLYSENDSLQESKNNLNNKIENIIKINDKIEKENIILKNEFNELNKKYEVLSENNITNENKIKQISLLTKTTQENFQLKEELTELKNQFNKINLPLNKNKSDIKLDVIDLKNEKENILNLNKFYLEKIISKIKEELNVSNEIFYNGAKSDLIDEFLFYFDRLKNNKLENKNRKEMYMKENQNLEFKIASLKRDLINKKSEQNNLFENEKRLTFGEYLNNKNLLFEFGKKRKSYQINYINNIF
jgi:hypothetical protein